MKMLKEERDARDFLRSAIQNDCDKPTASSLLSAAFRAVRANEREACAKMCVKQVFFRKPSENLLMNMACDQAAAAIRNIK